MLFRFCWISNIYFPLHKRYFWSTFYAFSLFIFVMMSSCFSMQVVKLIYTNSGGAILVLAENAVHKLWKWQKSERNLLGKVHHICCDTTSSCDFETHNYSFFYGFCLFRQTAMSHHSFGSHLVEY